MAFVSGSHAGSALHRQATCGRGTRCVKGSLYVGLRNAPSRGAPAELSLALNAVSPAWGQSGNSVASDDSVHVRAGRAGPCSRADFCLTNRESILAKRTLCRPLNELATLCLLSRGWARSVSPISQKSLSLRCLARVFAGSNRTCRKRCLLLAPGNYACIQSSD